MNKPIEFWKTVLFSDKSKFNIFGSDGPQYVWRKPRKELDPKNIIPTVKHGGGHALVWGCMGYAGVGELAIFEGIVNAKGCVNILRGNLKKSVCKLGIQDSYLFQQDNYPKHTACVTGEWPLYDAWVYWKRLHNLQISIR
jgi:hypothetical protein